MCIKFVDIRDVQAYRNIANEHVNVMVFIRCNAHFFAPHICELCLSAHCANVMKCHCVSTNIPWRLTGGLGLVALMATEPALDARYGNVV